MFRAFQSSTLSAKERQYHRDWVKLYGLANGLDLDGPLILDADHVMKFLVGLKQQGKPAWMRLKAVRALEFYRDRVLKSSEPSLVEFSSKLAEIAAKEYRVQDAPGAVGFLDKTERPLIRQLRRELRLKHYALRTETAYVGWVNRFLARFNVKHEAETVELTNADVKQFLTELAVEQTVASSTQNQALSALLYFFASVVERPLGAVDAVRARRPEQLPVVLSKDEVKRLLEQLEGRDLLLGRLLYFLGCNYDFFQGTLSHCCTRCQA